MHELWYPNFKGLFIPHRLQMVLAGTLAELRSSTLDASATFVHESIHWWQTAMTGHGHTTWHLFRQLTATIFNEWRRVTSESPVGRVVAIDELLSGPARDDLSLRANHHAARHVLRLASARFRSSQARTYRDLAEIPGLHAGAWKLNPDIEVGAGTEELQGMDVIEAHAHYLETIFLLVNEAPSSEVLKGFINVSPKYRRAIEWFLSVVPEKWWFTFPFVCDLSLQTISNDFPQSEREWQACSPSWRFVRLAEAISMGHGPQSTEDLLQKYDQAANDLLGYCGFFRIETVIEKALARSGYREPNMLIEQRMFDAMRFRRANPFCVAFPLIVLDVWEALQRDHFAPMVQVEGKLLLNESVDAHWAPSRIAKHS